MLHLRSNAASGSASGGAHLWRFLASEQASSSWDQALWTGVVVGLCLGFVAAVLTGWLVEQFQQKDAGTKSRPAAEAPSARRDEVPASPSRPKLTRHDVHSWLNECSEDEARRFFATCAQGPRGHILADSVMVSSPRLRRMESFMTQGSQLEQDGCSASELLLKDRSGVEAAAQEETPPQAPLSPASSSVPLLQFAQFLHLVGEGEECASLEVMRMGNLGVETQVDFSTKSASAVAGGSYRETAGTLVFAPGEQSKTIEVPIIDDDKWDASLEFKVYLVQDTVVNGKLEPSMWHARVKLIESSAFPTDKFGEQLKAGKIDEIPKFSMLHEYIMFNLSDPTVKRGTLKMILIEQCHNVNFFLRLCISIFLVDTVLTTRPGEQLGTQQDRMSALVGAALLNLLPLAVLHYCDFRALGMGVRGASKMTLQKALIAKLLSYGAESRTAVRPSTVTMAITHDAENLVDDGFMAIVGMAQSLGDIVTMLAFQVSVPLMLGRQLNLGVLAALFLLPVAEMLLFLARKELATAKLEEKHDKLEALSRGTSEIVEKQQMIATYAREAHTADKFAELVDAKNECDAGAARLLLNNSYTGTWLLTMAVSCYFFFGGREVLRGSLPLGLFLADISVIQTIGMSCKNITVLLQKMEMATPALERIAMLLNLPDDLPRRQALSKRTRADVKQLLDGLTQITSDDLPIRVANVQHKYTRPDCSVNLRGVLQIQQGSLVSLVGKRRQGKSTLLRLLGGQLLLQDESIAGRGAQVFIPPHVRVIPVAGEPLFFDSTLYDNLVYGVSHHKLADAGPGRTGSDDDAAMSRVVKICEMLGLSEDVLRYLHTSECHSWKTVLTSTDSYLLSLARAFVANPQVLCIHKPTLLFDEAGSRRILELLRGFVRERGLAQERPLHERRPRTCIFTSSKLDGLEISDQVFHVSSLDGIQAVDMDEVSPELL